MRTEDIEVLSKSITKMTYPFVAAYPDALQQKVNNLHIRMLGLYSRREDIQISYPMGDLTEKGNKELRDILSEYQDALTERRNELANEPDKHKLEMSFLDNALYNLNSMSRGENTIGTENQTSLNELMNKLPEGIKQIDSEEELEELEELQEKVPLYKCAEMALRSQKNADDIRKAEADENVTEERLQNLERERNEINQEAREAFGVLRDQADSEEMKAQFEYGNELDLDEFIDDSLKPAIDELDSKLPEVEESEENLEEELRDTVDPNAIQRNGQAAAQDLSRSRKQHATEAFIRNSNASWNEQGRRNAKDHGRPETEFTTEELKQAQEYERVTNKHENAKFTDPEVLKQQEAQRSKIIQDRSSWFRLNPDKVPVSGGEAKETKEGMQPKAEEMKNGQPDGSKPNMAQPRTQKPQYSQYTPQQIQQFVNFYDNKQRTAVNIYQTAEIDRRNAVMALQAMPKTVNSGIQDVRARQGTFYSKMQDLRLGQNYNAAKSPAYYSMEQALTKVIELNEKSSPAEIKKAYKDLQDTTSDYMKEYGGFGSSFRSQGTKMNLNTAKELNSLAGTALSSYNIRAGQDAQVSEAYDKFRGSLEKFASLKIQPDGKEKPASIAEIGQAYSQLANDGKKLAAFTINDPNTGFMVNSFNDAKFNYFAEGLRGIPVKLPLAYAPALVQMQRNSVIYGLQQQNAAKPEQMNNDNTKVPSLKEDPKAIPQDPQYDSLTNEAQRKNYFVAGWAFIAAGGMSEEQKAKHDKLFKSYMNPVKPDGTPDTELAESRRQGIEEARKEALKDSVRLRDDMFEGNKMFEKSSGKVYSENTEKKALADIMGEKLKAIDKEASRSREVTNARQKKAEQNRLSPQKVDSFSM